MGLLTHRRWTLDGAVGSVNGRLYRDRRGSKLIQMRYSIHLIKGCLSLYADVGICGHTSRASRQISCVSERRSEQWASLSNLRGLTSVNQVATFHVYLDGQNKGRIFQPPKIMMHRLGPKIHSDSHISTTTP